MAGTPPPQPRPTPTPTPQPSRRSAPSASPSARDKGPAMLKQQLIHPKILEVLGRAGHHARILIADGNYPASTKKGPNAELVCLNLMPGVVTCAQVLRAVLSAVPIDAVNTMMYESSDPYALDQDPPVWE